MGSRRWVSAVAALAAVVASVAAVAELHALDSSSQGRHARAELRTVISKMERLRTVRVSETLQTRTGGPTLRTEYRFAAPNRFAYDQAGISDASSVAIGATQYLRGSRNDTWRAGAWPDPAGFRWPHGFYNAFWTPATAFHSLGAARWHGFPSHVIAFSRADTKARFRLWIGDADGLVHHMEMRAPGHIMDQTYDRFDQPITITAPTG